MKTYKEFAPTIYDIKGLGLPEKAEWLVLPIFRTRDRSALDLSNFDVATDLLSKAPEGEFEIHRFSHWGPGWFEIFLILPGSEAALIAKSLEERLQNYPILDEEDFSNREIEESEGWGGL